MKKPSLTVNYLFNLGYQLLIVLVPLIVTPYVSRVLGAEGIGAYSYAQSIVSCFALAAALGFRGVALGIILLVFAAPVAVNSYTMALQMDGDANLAGGIVLLTTALSCFTLFLWIWLLKSLGLF